MADSVVMRHYRTGPCAPRPRLILDTVDSRCGDHLCWAYEDSQSWVTTVREFFAEGAGLGERPVYAGSVPMPGIGVSVPLATGRELDARWLTAMADAAVSSGYTGVRVVVDVSPLLTTDRGVDRHLAREVSLDRAVTTHPIALLCGFDRTRVSRLSSLSRLHPLTNVVDQRTDAAFWFVDRGWALSGEVDLAVTHDLRIALLAALAESEDELRVDCSAVTFLSVTGAEMLVEVARSTRARQRLVISNAPPAVRRVFDIGWPAGAFGLILDGAPLI